MKGHTLFFLTQEEFYEFQRFVLKEGYVPVAYGKIPRLYVATHPFYGYYESYSGKYAIEGYRLVRFNRNSRDNDFTYYFAKPEDVTLYGLQKMGLESIAQVYDYREELGHYERRT